MNQLIKFNSSLVKSTIRRTNYISLRYYSTLNNGGSNNNNNESKQDQQQKQEKKKKSLLLNPYTLALVGGTIGVGYYLINDKDFMFSSELPNISKENLDDFKKLYINKSNKTQSQPPVVENKDNIVTVRPTVLVLEEIQAKEEKEPILSKIEPEVLISALDDDEAIPVQLLLKDIQKEPEEPVVNHITESTKEIISEYPSKKHVIDEINQDEAELDSHYAKTHSNDDNNNNSNTEDDDNHKLNEKETLKVLSEITETQKNILVDEMVEHIKNEIERDNRELKHQQQESTVPIITTTTTNNTIPSKTMEDILKTIEEQYISKIEVLLGEKLQLSKEIENINNFNKKMIESIEIEVKNRYQEALNAAIEKMNKEFSDKVKELDNYMKDNVQENLSTLQSTLTKQKENLVSIFEEQAQSIKKSELEKKVISQLSGVVLEFRKLLSQTQQNPLDQQISQLKKDFTRLIDLAKYDELVKSLVSKLPVASIEANGIKDYKSLINEFKDLSKECRRITLLPNDDSLLGKAISKIAVNFIVPSEQNDPNDTDTILLRAEKHLIAGDISKTIKEVESVSKKSKQLDITTRAWLRSARDRDQIENLIKLLEIKLELLNDKNKK